MGLLGDLAVLVTWVCLMFLIKATGLGNVRNYSEMRCELYFPKQNLPLEVYWINLDKSLHRRVFMQNQLKYYGLINNHRVRALVPDQVITKFSRSDQEGCLYNTESEVEIHMKEIIGKNKTNHNSHHNSTIAVHKTQNYTLNSHRYVAVQSVCGRPKNSLRELIVTLSHLNALNYATRSRNARHSASTASSSADVDLSEYALILEDDLQFAFEINFQQLISHAPKDFAIVQLVTSNDYSVLNLWKVFDRHRMLFVKRKPHDDYWCAGAYIIHKERLFQYTHQLLYRKQGNHYLTSQILTGYEKPCHPSICCDANRTFIKQPPCITASRGYAADNLIFSLSFYTYMLTIPIMLTSNVGNVSTLHQKHVDFHQAAFRRMKMFSDILVEEWFNTTSAASPTTKNAVYINKHPALKTMINPTCRYYVHQQQQLQQEDGEGKLQ
jgi:GR25 family glycosyltransferase involved in LPS biosynthesis